MLGAGQCRDQCSAGAGREVFLWFEIGSAGVIVAEVGRGAHEKEEAIRSALISSGKSPVKDRKSLRRVYSMPPERPLVVRNFDMEDDGGRTHGWQVWLREADHIYLKGKRKRWTMDDG